MRHQTVDKVCFWSSLICTGHCALTPLILVVLPYFGMLIWSNETFEQIFISVSAILAFGSICYGYTKHKTALIFIPVSLGIIILLVGIFHHEHNNFGALRSAFGGLLLSISHYLNYLMCKSCDKCEHNIS
jgi:hypothetical protein